MSKKTFAIIAALVGLNFMIANTSAWALVNDADVWGVNGVSEINGVETAHNIAAALANQEIHLSIANEMALGTYGVSPQGELVESNVVVNTETNGLKAASTGEGVKVVQIEVTNPYTAVTFGTLNLDTQAELQIILGDVNAIADGTKFELLRAGAFSVNGEPKSATQALGNFSKLTIYRKTWNGSSSLLYQSTNSAEWQRSVDDTNKTYVIADDTAKTFSLMFNRYAVPEPGTFVMMGLGVFGLLFMARCRKSTK